MPTDLPGDTERECQIPSIALSLSTLKQKLMFEEVNTSAVKKSGKSMLN